MEKIKKIIIPVVVVVVLLGIAAILYLTGNNMPREKAVQKAMDYINNVALADQGVTATLVSSENVNGIYQFKLKVNEQEYTSYITKDGKLLFSAGIEIPDDVSGKETEVPKADKPEALLFVMSFCPYGNQAEEAMDDVVGLLKDKADIQLHYVIYENYNGGGASYCLDKENKYCSMHGIQELNQDVREMCVQKYQGDKFWSFVAEINKSCTAQNVDTCWEGVANKTGINVSKIKICQKDEAIDLLKSEVELSTKYRVTGSPQLIINDQEYSGARSSEGYKAGICAGFNTEPTECSQSLSAEGGTVSGGCE